jgi:hypothetical protein
MNSGPFHKLHPEIIALYAALRYEIQQAQRPANEVILDDNAVMDMLKISKRKLQYFKADGILPYHKLTGSPRTYYFLSDILEILNRNRVSAINSILTL